MVRGGKRENRREKQSSRGTLRQRGTRQQVMKAARTHVWCWGSKSSKVAAYSPLPHPHSLFVGGSCFRPSPFSICGCLFFSLYFCVSLSPFVRVCAPPLHGLSLTLVSTRNVFTFCLPLLSLSLCNVAATAHTTAHCVSPGSTAEHEYSSSVRN